MVCVTYKWSSGCLILLSIALAISTSATTNGLDLNYRLPNNTEPIHYNIELTTNVHNGTKEFKGRVEILLTAAVDTTNIVLHAVKLEAFQATIKSADAANAAEYPLSWTYEPEREFLHLTTKNETTTLKSGTKWVLTIAYGGQLVEDNKGFFLQSYTDSSTNVHYMASTQFEPIYARRAFPCYDEPAKRTTFTVTIKHDPSYNALSNMPKNKSASSTGVTVFDKTNFTMPTYLVAFHVSDYVYIAGELDSIPQRLYSKPEGLPRSNFALISGMEILEYFITYFQVPYDLTKLGQVTVPDKIGGMENYGLITYGENDLFLNATTSTTSTQVDLAVLIAHEMIHQFLGNHVTIRWWTYLWLKEGFAQMYSYTAVNEVHPEWDIFQIMHTDEYQPSLASDGNEELVPMTHYVQTQSEISARYDSSSYAKPDCILYMWQQALGDEVYRSALNKYLNDNAFSSTEEWQLFAALQNAVIELNVTIPASIDVMFPTWTHQTGYPLLTVTRNYTSKTFTVTQTAYNHDKTITSSKTYYVPFNYATRSKSDFRNTKATNYLQSTEVVTIVDNELGADDWLILNKQSSGYYRINYDDTNWRLIAQGLLDRPSKVHPRNRAQLLDDAFELVETERLQHDILLELLTYLPGEDQYAPWLSAATILSTYNAYLSGDAEYNKLKEFIALLASNIYKTLGVNEVPGEQLLRKFTRNRAVNLACLAGIEDCLKESNQKLKTHINKGVGIEPNLKQQAYCNGLRKSSDNDYNYYFNDFLESGDTKYRGLLLGALGCSENITQIQKFLSLSLNLNNSLIDDDRLSIVNSTFSKSELGLLVSIDFLNNNWEAYGKLSNETGNSNQLNMDIVEMANYINNIDQQNKILALVDQVKNSSFVDENLEADVKANMKLNFDWLDKNREPIMSFIKRYLSNQNRASLRLS